MFIKENISIALAGLLANKMRALLTMLGIIIGIASVIAIVCVGNSLTSSVTSNMAGIGANNIYVTIREKDAPSFGPNGGFTVASEAFAPSEDDFYTSEQIEYFASTHKDCVEAIGYTYSLGSGQVLDGHLNANVNIIGANDGIKLTNNLVMKSGRFITQKDTIGVRHVAVVSDKLVNNMFPFGSDPIGREIKLYTDKSIETYIIVGVYEYQTNSFMFNTASEKDISTDLYIPKSVASASIANKNFMYFTVKAAAGFDSKELTGLIESYFSKFYVNNNKYKPSVISMESTISSLASMLDTISIAIAIIAAISLLVGGIGVMNIMLVSVTERTREIGTRKALGAKNSYIRIQFIVESVIICVIGGIIGVILGILLGNVGASLLGYPTVVSIPIILISVTFSMAIGVFFGFYPANKAAKLDPIEALRYE